MADLLSFDGSRDKKLPLEPKVYEIVLLPTDDEGPKGITELGFLITLGDFMGIIDETQDIKVLVPSVNVLYVRQVSFGPEETIQ